MPEARGTGKFKQITVGQWNGGSGLSFSVVGLTEDGRVYKHTMNGWVDLGTGVCARPSRAPKLFDGPMPTDEDNF